MTDSKRDKLEGAVALLQHDIDRRVRRDRNETVCAAENRDGAGFGETTLQSIGARVSSHGNDVRAVARDLVGEQRRVVAGGERRHAEALRMRVDNSERTLPDRSRRAENREVPHATRPCRTMK